MTTAYFDDPAYLERVEREAMTQVPVGPTAGVWEQAGVGFMRGGALAADALRMAAAVPVVAFADDDIEDAYFAATDDVINRAIDHWTPDPRTTTTAGRIVGGLSEALLPLMAGGGNPALLMGSATARTSKALAVAGVEGQTAVDVGMVDAFAIGLGFKVPALGRTLVGKLALGAGVNVALGGGAAAVQAGALAEAGHQDLAEQYDPWNLEARAIEAGLGALFGGLAHFLPAPRPDAAARVGAAFSRELDAFLTYRTAQHWQSMAPGAPKGIRSSTAHAKAMEATVRAMMQDGPIPAAEILAGAEFDGTRAAPRVQAEADMRAVVSGELRPDDPVLDLGTPRTIAGVDPDALMEADVQQARAVVDASPDLILPLDDDAVRAADVMADADRAVTEAETTYARAAEAAAACFMGPSLADATPGPVLPEAASVQVAERGVDGRATRFVLEPKPVSIQVAERGEDGRATRFAIESGSKSIKIVERAEDGRATKFEVLT